MSHAKLAFSCWFGWFLAIAQVSSSWAASTAPVRSKAHGLLANEFQAPISFEPNQGQTDSRVKFMARGSGYNFFLTPSNALFFLRQADSRDDLVPTDSDVFAMTVIGANPVSRITGQDELPSTSSYFLGSDPKRWHTNIPNFGKVQYEDIYPGIDLLYHGVEGQLEYDFVLHPGSSPETIIIEFAGVNNVHLTPRGELVLKTARGAVWFHSPVAYQEVQGQRRIVKARYRQMQKHRVGFTIGVYDVSKTLVIDPVLAARYLAAGDRTPGREINVPASRIRGLNPGGTRGFGGKASRLRGLTTQRWVGAPRMRSIGMRQSTHAKCELRPQIRRPRASPKQRYRLTSDFLKTAVQIYK